MNNSLDNKTLTFKLIEGYEWVNMTPIDMLAGLGEDSFIKY